MSLWDSIALFLSAAIPLDIIPPLFNRYENNESFGFHVDNSNRRIRGSNERLRTDFYPVRFFSVEPEEYVGGELVVEDTYGYHEEQKLPAGDMILYPSTSLHEKSRQSLPVVELLHFFGYKA